MKKDMKKLYKTMSKGKDFFPFALKDDKLIIAYDYKDDVELPDGYSVKDGEVYFGSKKIGVVEYEGAPEEEVEEDFEEDFDDDEDFDDEEEKSESNTKKSNVSDIIANMRKQAGYSDDDFDDDEYDDDYEDDYDDDDDWLDDEDENEEENTTSHVDNTKSESRARELTEAEKDEIIARAKMDKTNDSDDIDILGKIVDSLKYVGGTKDARFFEDFDGDTWKFDEKTGELEIVERNKDEEEEKTDDERLVEEVNKELKNTNPNVEIKVEPKDDKKDDVDVSESTNIFEVAQVIANMNPDVEIAVGDFENDPDCNTRIFASVPGDELDLPKGFRYTDKKGITSKNNADFAFIVENIKNATEDLIVRLKPENEELEVEPKRKGRFRRFVQKVVYGISRFFKKGKTIDLGDLEDEEKEEETKEDSKGDDDKKGPKDDETKKDSKDTKKSKDDSDVKADSKDEKIKELEEKLASSMKLNEDYLKAINLSQEKATKLEEKISELNAKIDALNSKSDVKNTKPDNKVVVDEPKKYASATSAAKVSVPNVTTTESDVKLSTPDVSTTATNAKPSTPDVSVTATNAKPSTPDVKNTSTTKDGAYKFEFTSKEDVISKFADEDKAVIAKEEKEKAEIAKLEELSERIASYEEFLKEHTFTHTEDIELRDRMMSKLEYFREKYTEVLEARKNASVEPENRTEKMAYYTQTARGINQAISDLILERRTKELLLRSTNQFMSLKEARSYDERIAELKALRAKCVERKEAVNATYVEEGNRILNAARSKSL